LVLVPFSARWLAPRRVIGIRPISLGRVQKRYYARSNPRRTTVAEDVDVKQDTSLQQDQKQQQWQQQQQQQQTQYESPEDEGQSTMDSITPDLAAHLGKVYGSVMGATAACAAGGIVGIFVPFLSLPAMLLSLASIFGVIMTSRERTTLRTSFFVATAGFLGLSAGPLIGASTLGTVIAAALGTTGIFAGFSFMALKAKRGSMLRLGGPLLGGLLALIACGLGGMLLPLFGVTNPALLGALYNINLYGGLALFSVLISYDTQRMIEDYKAGNNDHLLPALNMFLNLFNIFIRLLQILRGD